MKSLIVLFIIIGTSADSGIFAQIGNYWMFGQRFADYSVAIDSNSQCVVYDGTEKPCTMQDWSIILASKNLVR